MAAVRSQRQQASHRMPNCCVRFRARREARAVRGFEVLRVSPRATARMFWGAPAGADGRARPTERESVRREAAEAARMGRARGGRGFALPLARSAG